MKGCLLFIGAVAGGLCLGVAVSVALRFIINNDDVSNAVGTAVWLWSFVLFYVYGTLWIADPYEIANPPLPGSIIQRWRTTKAERKLQTAELRIGIVFAAIGGSTASFAKGSPLLIATVAILTGIVGGFVGHDLTRRVRLIRERHTRP